MEAMCEYIQQHMSGLHTATGLCNICIFSRGHLRHRMFLKMYPSMETWINTVLWTLLMIVPSLGQENLELSRKEVMATLLNDKYDRNIVPDFDKDVPTNVTIQLVIQDMHSVSETAMEYSIDTFLRMKWLDERLDYTNLSSKPKLELDSKNIDKVWQPDVYFKNEKRAAVHSVTVPNKLMHIHRNGLVVYSVRIAMTLGCTMRLQYYPFDKQRCPLFIQSYGYSLDNIDLGWAPGRPVKLDKELEMPQFEVGMDIKTFDYTVDVTSTGTFSTLHMELNLTRNVGFYFLQVFIPSILLILLSWVSFWVDPNAVPARVSLGVTCVLTMTTQSAGLRQSLPPVSYVKAIDIWMCVCLVFVFAALLEFAYVNVLMRQKSTPKTDNDANNKVDDNMETSFDNSNSANNEEAKSKPEHMNQNFFERLKSRLFPVMESGRAKATHVDHISRVLFPGSFVLFLLIFFIVCYTARALTFVD